MCQTKQILRREKANVNKTGQSADYQRAVKRMLARVGSGETERNGDEDEAEE